MVREVNSDEKPKGFSPFSGRAGTLNICDRREKVKTNATTERWKSLQNLSNEDS